MRRGIPRLRLPAHRHTGNGTPAAKRATPPAVPPAIPVPGPPAPAPPAPPPRRNQRMGPLQGEVFECPGEVPVSWGGGGRGAAAPNDSACPQHQHLHQHQHQHQHATQLRGQPQRQPRPSQQFPATVVLWLYIIFCLFPHTVAVRIVLLRFVRVLLMC